MPLSGGRVIPAGWSAHHRPVSESAMTATCRVEVPGTPGAFDDDTGYRTASTPTVLYEGKARVMVNFRPQSANLAEQDTSTQRYTVAIPNSGPTIPYAAVVVVTATKNPRLLGRAFYVESAAISSENFEQVLTVIETATPGTT